MNTRLPIFVFLPQSVWNGGNLFYNAAMFVEAGLGSAICIDGVVPHEFASRVAFRPFSVALTSDVYLAWRKNAALPPAAAAIVETVRVLSSGRQV